MAGFVSPFVRKLERKLLPNQCHVTISDLAEFWHWHRATVRTFLDALESFGLLERTKLNKSVIVPEKGIKELLLAIKQIQYLNFKLLIIGSSFFSSDRKTSFIEEMCIRDRSYLIGVIL